MGVRPPRLNRGVRRQRTVRLRFDLGSSWQELDILAKIAVLLLLVSAVPTGIALWRLAVRSVINRSGRPSIPSQISTRLVRRPAIGAARWAMLEASALVLALGLLWVGWARQVGSMDCAGAGCNQGRSELSAVHITFASLSVIPLFGAVGWLVIGRSKSAPPRSDA